MSKRRKYGD